MNFDGMWDNTRGSLLDAYGDAVGLVIGLLEAAVVVVIASFVARWLKRRVQRSLMNRRIDRNLAALVVNAAAVGVYLLGATLVLGLLGASWTALLAAISVGTLAISLALQDVLKNFVAGIYLLLERPFAIGERVRVRDVTGIVESIDFRTTVLRNERQERVLVPNATLFGEILVNRSVSKVDRTTLVLRHPPAPPSELLTAVTKTLAAVPGLGAPRPTLELAGASNEGIDVRIGLWSEPGSDVVSTAIVGLRERFPDVAIVVEEAQ